MKLRVGLVFALFAACSAPAEPCEWASSWTPTEIENGCNLTSLGTDGMGCDVYINAMTEGEECTRAAEWACANGRLTVWYDGEGRRGVYSFEGANGCLTTALLVPGP